MAVVIVGGMISTALITLFVVPALYLRLGAGSELDLAIVLAEPTIDLTREEPAELTSH
jgi:hypothetical protein